MADVAHAEDVIETDERAFIHSIIDFGDTVVREVMVPRPDMVTLEADDTRDRGAGDRARPPATAGCPSTGTTSTTSIGIAYTKDLMRIERAGRGAEQVADHARAAHFVPETKRVAACCARCRTASSTSRSSSTSTAARPASSRWRT